MIILRSLMKIKIKDYFILKFIGMKIKTINRISILEMFSYCTVSVIFVMVVFNIIAVGGSGTIMNMLAYYTIPFYLIYIIYNLVLCGITVKAFNKLIGGRFEK